MELVRETFETSGLANGAQLSNPSKIILKISAKLYDPRPVVPFMYSNIRRILANFGAVDAGVHSVVAPIGEN